MQSLKPYKDINQVMRGLRIQIIESVPYCYNNLPHFENPRQLFKYLKERTRFKHDAPNEETLQTAQTLFDNNVHGQSGAGDCDCFTILATACFIAQGWGDIQIILAGRDRRTPVHIYNRLKFDGETINFDLTEPYYNTERQYKYKQILPIRFFY